MIINWSISKHNIIFSKLGKEGTEKIEAKIDLTIKNNLLKIRSPKKIIIKTRADFVEFDNDVQGAKRTKSTSTNGYCRREDEE